MAPLKQNAPIRRKGVNNMVTEAKGIANAPKAQTKEKVVAEKRTLLLGMKHNKPVSPAGSDIGSDIRLDPAVADKFLFDSKGNKIYQIERWIPSMSIGPNLSAEQAKKVFGQFVEAIEEYSHATHVRCEGKDGDVFYDAETPHGGDPSKMAGRPVDVQSAASTALTMLRNAWVLANNQDANQTLRAEMIKDADNVEILKQRGITDRDSAQKAKGEKGTRQRASKENSLR